MNATSVTMIDRLQERADAGTWEHFCNLYTPLLLRWLRHHDLFHHDAEEVVQEVLTVIAKELPKFRHNDRPGAFRSWLRTILVHRLRNFRRGQRQRRAISNDLLDQVEDPKSSQARLFDLEHDLFITHRALATIEPEFQPSTWLAFRRLMLDNVAPVAVAAELGISLAAVYTAKSRIMKRLRHEIQGFI